MQAVDKNSVFFTGKGGVLRKGSSGYEMIEISEEDRKSRADLLRGLIEKLRGLVRIVPVPELAAVPVERRKVLQKAFGTYGAETILVAAIPGRVLWTDDLAMARFAATEYGAKRIWTQNALQIAVDSGRLDASRLFEATAKLLAFGYWFTSTSLQSLMKATEMANFDPNQWPLGEALQHFGDEAVQLRDAAALFAAYLIWIYRQSILEDRATMIVLKCLDGLGRRTEGLTVIQAVLKAIPQIFGLNVTGADQASNVIKGWLAARNLVSLDLFER